MHTDIQQTLPTVTHSRRLWGLDWRRTTPWTFDDIRVESAVFDEALPFMREHYASIFGSQPNECRFLASPMTPAKRRFCDESDVFLFRDAGRTIGLMMANPADWSTYYMRSVAVLPEYRDRRLLTRFMTASYAPLREAGVERIEGECSPANAPMMRMLVGQGFLVTSTANSERWGATVRFTKFLSEEAESVFLRQFNSVTPTRKAMSPTVCNERSTS
jgi:ribosomal protein S18 acetylase RimI-like enzyme